MSDAIGAFMAGLVLSSTVAAARIRHLVVPFRDAFAAVFFFAFGLSIDPGAISSVPARPSSPSLSRWCWPRSAAIVVARHQRPRPSGDGADGHHGGVRGEFSLILVALAVGAGLDERLSPLIAVYVLVLAVLSPILAEHSDRLFRGVIGADPTDDAPAGRRAHRSEPGSG